MSFESESLVFLFLLFYFTVNTIANKNSYEHSKKQMDTKGLAHGYLMPLSSFCTSHTVAHTEIINFVYKMAL